MSFTFQKIVLIVATIFLVFILFVVGITLYSHHTDVKFPPVISACPDYWDISGNITSGYVCNNTHELDSGGCGSSFNFDKYKGHNADCLKAIQARKCGLTWQGITTNPDICDKV